MSVHSYVTDAVNEYPANDWQYGMSSYCPKSHLDAICHVGACRLLVECIQKVSNKYNITSTDMLAIKHQAEANEKKALIILNQFSTNYELNNYLANAIKDKFNLTYITGELYKLSDLTKSIQ
jgi:hypothetical protein